MDFSTFLSLLERVGFPVAALIVMSYAVYKILIWVGEKVVTPIAASHVALVESTKKTSELNALTLEKIASALETKARSLTELTKQNERTLSLIEEVGRLVKEKK